MQALEEHRAGLDIGARRLHARRAGALLEFTHEHGERGLRTLGGRSVAEQLLQSLPADLEVPALLRALERKQS